MQRLGSPSFELRFEVPLSIEPQRADILLLRRKQERRGKAQLLRGLWRRLGKITILEYKSPVDSSYRPRDLLRLVGYGVQYDTTHVEDVPRPRDLTLTLVLPAIVPTLHADVRRMGWSLAPGRDGYARIEGAPYAIVVVTIDEVHEAEKGEILATFSRRHKPRGAAALWMREWMAEETMKQPSMKKMEGYDDLFQKLVEQMPVEKRLAGLAPEQRLAGLAPEQRLAGLAPEQRLVGLAPEQRLAGLDAAHAVLALPIELLRVIPEDYLRSLPADVQKEVKKRLRRARSAEARRSRAA